jgi:hypothetical protein
MAMKREALLSEMVSRLQKDVGEHLEGVVLYGPEAHGDTYRAVSPLYLLLVLRDLEPASLRLLGGPVHWWLGKGQPWPRLFTEELLRDSADVYPIELLDISRHHKVLCGRDPLGGVEIDRAHLRLQCERELREKLMRLREGYVEARGSGGALAAFASSPARSLRALLAASYPSFAPVWRGCLHLLGAEVPLHDLEVARALAARLDLEQAPFDEVARIADGEGGADVEATYERYQRALAQMVARVDRWVSEEGGS